MLAPRRFLPSISLLSAFEAAARTQSFTEAARELDLTQSAVSRQIMALEGQLGVELFIRDKKRVHLTLAGERYATEIRNALKSIASASLALKANPEGGTLNLAILPTFGTRWLAPRLPDFLSKHPGVTAGRRECPYEHPFVHRLEKAREGVGASRLPRVGGDGTGSVYDAVAGPVGGAGKV